MKFRQRAGHGAEYHPVKAKISKYSEMGVAIFEIFLLLGLSMPVWAEYKDRPPAEKDNPLRVRVVAQQFQWNFHYSGNDGKFGRTSLAAISESNPLGLVEDDEAGKDDVFRVNEFYLPVDRPIYVQISSKDVIHSFDIPAARVKQDAIPGMQIPVWFKIKPEFTSDRLRTAMTETYPVEKLKWYKHRHHIAVQDHKSKSGEVILAAGADLGLSKEAGDQMIEKLKKSGITEVVMHPRHPLEVVCAQLCGNEHYKMKAQMIAMSGEEFKSWLDEEIKKKTKGVEFDEF
jgi:cytochrome c oxidase subunit 2